jgi:CRP-like cAMP-binding protein
VRSREMAVIVLLSSSMNTPKVRMTGQRHTDTIVLPGGDVRKHYNEELIYRPETGSQNLYLVIDGQVTVARMTDPRNPVIVEICRPGDFFGEAALLGQTGQREAAIAIQDVTLRIWSPEAIEEMLEKQPRLAMLLYRALAQRLSALEARITSLAVDKVPQRLARALILLSDRLGHTRKDGDNEMPALTHGVLAQYVGTSREIVTHHMNKLRRGQYIDYSRKAILVRTGALAASLLQ